MPATPFTDPDLITHQLYAQPKRITQRTHALHAAKISGGDATDTIIDLVKRATRPSPVIADIGCGRGTTTLHLATHLDPARLIAVDQSAALLDVVADRLAAADRTVETVCADFHHLPLPDDSLDLAVAAFCLYHSPTPEKVVADIMRCLTPGGKAVIVTKSANSYSELDQLLTYAGLDIDAATRPSLYSTFHSDNAADTVNRDLCVEDVLHQQHVFRFAGLDHLASYLATSPKYQLAERLATDAGRLARELRRRLPDTPIRATSTVTYVTAARP